MNIYKTIFQFNRMVVRSNEAAITDTACCQITVCMEVKEIVALFFIRIERACKAGMSANGKIHCIIAGIFNCPCHCQMIVKQKVTDFKNKRERVFFKRFFVGGQLEQKNVFRVGF